MSYIEWPEFKAIAAFYSDRVAERSKVPLIKHVVEGLSILRHLEADEDTKRAFCLHPLFQADGDLNVVGRRYVEVAEELGYRARPIFLTMEYRNQANAWLSDKVWIDNPTGRPMSLGSPWPGPLLEVKQMLIADKVQNYKDFRIHHRDTHERSAELEVYFLKWLDVLGVSDKLMLNELEAEAMRMRP